MNYYEMFKYSHLCPIIYIVYIFKYFKIFIKSNKLNNKHKYAVGPARFCFKNKITSLKLQRAPHSVHIFIAFIINYNYTRVNFYISVNEKTKTIIENRLIDFQNIPY